MSIATVRTAVTRYLADAEIPGLNRVFKALPWYVDGDVFDLAATLGSGAVAYVHLAESVENRLALPAVLGSQNVHYEVAVIVAYQYLIPSAQVDPTLSEDDWVDQLDAIMQGVKDRIHIDPNLGAPDVVFLAAQTPRTLRVASYEPRQLPGKIISMQSVEFQLTEIIQA